MLPTLAKALSKKAESLAGQAYNLQQWREVNAIGQDASGLKKEAYERLLNTFFLAAGAYADAAEAWGAVVHGIKAQIAAEEEDRKRMQGNLDRLSQ